MVRLNNKLTKMPRNTMWNQKHILKNNAFEIIDHKQEISSHTSKKLGLIVTAEANSAVCPKLKFTQFSKDEASKLIGILPQEHFPLSSVLKIKENIE
jgi:hypothetical protein